MVRRFNISSIEKATGKSWAEWLVFFESIDAKNLSHKEIAQKVQATGVSGWWSQSIAVAYEQHIGRRVPGQDCNGEFQVSVSKTFDGIMDEALENWVHLMDGREELSDIAISRGPTTSSTEKWRHWYCGLADGSRVAVNIYQKSPDKASFGLGHEKIESSEQAEHWRTFWKELLNNI